MGFMSWIIQRLNDAGGVFYSLYVNTFYLPSPFDSIASWFYELALTFNGLAWNFYHFSEWVDDTTSRLALILSWQTIWSYLISQVPNLEEIRDWFYSWREYVNQAISSWWSTTETTIKSWIDTAFQVAETQINGLISSLANLDALWDNFVNVTLPSLASWEGVNLLITSRLQELSTWGGELLAAVNQLIDDAFSARSSLWEGWQEQRDKLTAFFVSPLDNLLDDFTNWFLGKEE